jgi:hypothetical protein
MKTGIFMAESMIGETGRMVKDFPGPANFVFAGQALIEVGEYHETLSFVPRLTGLFFQRLVYRGYLPPPHSLRQALRFYPSMVLGA